MHGFPCPSAFKGGQLTTSLFQIHARDNACVTSSGVLQSGQECRKKEWFDPCSSAPVGFGNLDGGGSGDVEDQPLRAAAEGGIGAVEKMKPQIRDLPIRAIALVARPRHISCLIMVFLDLIGRWGRGDACVHLV
ncbi:hypothetical protein RRF57_000021 [Xylaria bambusicola]|uniref:Uncharacterized protein n=1 Tax=Xylaria bambusicola TaxID=326684 RepID=A0AAN7YTT4_9PEZI